MRVAITALMVLGIVGLTVAQDLGNKMPTKPAVTFPENTLDPERQGGDTIFNATVIPYVPYSDSGTTTGYANNYDAVCPYSGSTAPDVVYRYTAMYDEMVNIDLCHSSYDTKLYVWDQNLNLVACNDDHWFEPPCCVYSSYLENVSMSGGITYYIIVDGYDSANGNYVLDVSPGSHCDIWCPDGGFEENEPPLVNDYVDNHNGGCNTDPDHPFQFLVGDENGELLFCGVTGWFQFGGSQSRDTDWYVLTMGPGEAIDIVADVDPGTYFFELGPQGCDAVDVLQSIDVQHCQNNTMTISGYAPGTTVWFWAGPDNWDAPANPYEYEYVVWFSGLEPIVATDPATWSTVKALYD